jgi:hypothetical protein
VELPYISKIKYRTSWDQLFFVDMEHIKPCSACSWTPERQDGCRYESHVKIIYEMSDRGVWSLGSNLILKERSTAPPNFDALNLRFVENESSIPVPHLVEDWVEEDGRQFILMKRIRGQPLNTLWSSMSLEEKERVAKETAEYLNQLRKLCSPKMQSLQDQPIYSAFLFPTGYGLPHGPFSSDDELWADLEKALSKVPEDARRRLRERMPPAAPYTFTHCDLTNMNIMVEDGHLTGIIDWESSGYFPVWWEFTSAGIGLGEEDKEWKTLLQKYMPDYSSAREFWLDYWYLSKYPNLNDRALKILDGRADGD